MFQIIPYKALSYVKDIATLLILQNLARAYIIQQYLIWCMSKGNYTPCRVFAKRLNV